MEPINANQQKLQDVEDSTENRLKVSETLIVGIDIGNDNDISVLQVMRYSKGVRTVINTLYGSDAINAYCKLTNTNGYGILSSINGLSPNMIRHSLGLADFIPKEEIEK